tara:strand:+ start:37488 stop:37967 length:480 start_codon:yes stop_codon:yes gene_type:complete
MKIPSFILLIVLSASSIDSQAQTLNSFLGEWKGSGFLMGNEADFQMKWEQVLNEQFFKLTFRNSISSASFSMDAHSYYKLMDDGTVSGYWFDSRGISFPLSGNFKDQTLIIHWGTPEIEQGRTEYTLLKSNEISVNDFVLRNGEYAQFGEVTYQLKPNK